MLGPILACLVFWLLCLANALFSKSGAHGRLASFVVSIVLFFELVTLLKETASWKDGLKFVKTYDGICITACSEEIREGRIREVKIPQRIRGEAVTSIGDEVFSSCYKLTSVEIPEGITSIGNRAFYYCSNLKSVMIPSSVTSIGNEVFCYCKSLTSVDIPEGISKIGDSMFYGCESLTSIEIPPSVTNIG